MRETCQRCGGKRLFGSACAARRAHKGAGYRLRAYRCPAGSGWHVTASEKAGASSPIREAPHSKRQRRGPSLAPVRTLAEVEAIAAQKRFGPPGCAAHMVVQGAEGLVRLTPAGTSEVARG